MDGPSLDRLRTPLARVLDDQPAVAAAYAYGSRVHGRPHPLSDLDLAIVLSEVDAPDDPLLAERLAARIATELGTRVEIDVHLARDLPFGVRGRAVAGQLVSRPWPVSGTCWPPSMPLSFLSWCTRTWTVWTRSETS